jgi:hypothetical protein
MSDDDTKGYHIVPYAPETRSLESPPIAPEEIALEAKVRSHPGLGSWKSRARHRREVRIEGHLPTEAMEEEEALRRYALQPPIPPEVQKLDLTRRINTIVELHGTGIIGGNEQDAAEYRRLEPKVREMIATKMGLPPKREKPVKPYYGPKPGDRDFHIRNRMPKKK